MKDFYVENENKIIPHLKNKCMHSFNFKIAFILIFIILFMPFIIPFGCNSNVYAVENELNNGDMIIYVIYDENGDYLFERYNVVVGDEYIDKNMNCYEVFFIDESTKTGKAKYIKTYKIPKLKEKKASSVSASNSALVRGTIGLYMSHNDESYVSGDGYDSIYGKGGIHDIAKSLASSLGSKSIDVVLDETLHLPHDSYAYTRSNVTAKRLLNNYNLDGLFDVHRDGTSRGFYITKVDGVEHCMVRMVIGKANSNYETNKGFALYLMSVAEIYCPWLFVDIYMASGHYNQALKDNMVLFEMGSHLVEKDLVLETVPRLAEVVSVALFGEFEEVEEGENNSNNNQSGGNEASGGDNNKAESESGTTGSSAEKGETIESGSNIGNGENGENVESGSNGESGNNIEVGSNGGVINGANDNDEQNASDKDNTNTGQNYGDNAEQNASDKNSSEQNDNMGASNLNSDETSN
ncbi:MAG: stage II sporulation protein P, partial [Christensenellales bacterium]